MRRWADCVIRYRVAFLVFLVVAVVCSAVVIPTTRLDMGIHQVITGDKEARKRLSRDFKRLPPLPISRFYCVLTWPEPLTKDDLGWLRDLCKEINEDGRVAGVLSLGNAPVLRPGGLLPQPFLKTIGDRTVLEAANAHPLFERRLISRDGRSACLVLTQGMTTAKIEVVAWLEKLIAERAPQPIELRFIASSLADVARRGYMAADLFNVVLLELVLFSLLLPFLFRTVRGVVVPLVCAIFAVVLNLGLLHLFDRTIGIIEIAIPGLIVMIGLSDAVHMLHRYEEAREGGADRPTAIRYMTSRVGIACLITSLTTAVAFLSLLVTGHEMIRGFAWKAAAAVMVTFGVTMLVLPLGLSLLPLGKPVVPRVAGTNALTYGRRGLTALLFVAVLGLAGFGASGIAVEARWLEELPDHDPIKSHVTFLEDQFRGIITIEAGIDADLREPKTFAGLERFQERMLQVPDVLACESITQWLRAANGNPEKMTAASMRRGALTLNAMSRMENAPFPAHLAKRDFRSGRVVFHIQNVSSRRYIELRDEIVKVAKETAPELDIWPTGFGLMAYETGQLVAETLVESLLFSLAAITLLILVLYRSWRLGLISILPNAAPVLVALGINGLLDIPLRIGIVMIYSLGLGLAVDDSVHLITRWRQERAQDPTATPRTVVLRALRSTGTALVVTSAILIVGSLCFLVSNFQSAYDVGILLTSVVVTALVMDLFVLPHLLERFARR